MNTIKSLVKIQIESILILYVVDNTDQMQIFLMKVLDIMSFHIIVLKVDIFSDCPLRLEVQNSMKLI